MCFPCMLGTLGKKRRQFLSKDSLREREEKSILQKRGKEEAHDEEEGLSIGYGFIELPYFHLNPNQDLSHASPPPATS